MEEAKRPTLFISHHSSKYEVAQHVEKALARHGVDCWIAPRDVGPGEAFDTAIMKAIRDCAGHFRHIRESGLQVPLLDAR